MALEELKLKKNQEIRSINLEPADNGGCILRYTIYTPAIKNNESNWDEKNEVFPADEVDSVAIPRLVQLYKLSLSSQKIKAQNISSAKEG